MKYVPARDIPDFARELKTVSPSAISELILKRRNVERTAESVTMWFKDHPDILEQLQKESIEGLPTEKQAVDDSIFNNGNFQALPTVKRYMEILASRELTEETVTQKLGLLKNACRGTVGGHDLVAEGKMTLKHPDRLAFQDLLEINALLKSVGVDTTAVKGVLKDFLENVQDIPIGKKITVGKHRSFGKYAKLHVEMSKLQAILAEVKSQNYEAYAVDLFMFKTGTRVSATLAADLKDFYVVGSEGQVTVFDKGRKSKYPHGHPWDKDIDAELLEALTPLIQGRKSGLIFAIKVDTLAHLNHAAIMKFASEVFERYPTLMPNHFWRHMFAQHMLRLTNWNYAAVGAMGGWTPQALEESYGQPPLEARKDWNAKYKLQVGLVVEVKA